MGLGEIRDLLAVASTSIGLISLFYAYFAKRSAATAIELKAAHDRVDKLEERMLKVETDVEHLPSKETSHRMELAIAEMRGDMKTLNASLQPIAATVERVQEYMLKEKK